jgi:glycogen synthase
LSTWVEKIALENADRIISVSNNSREDILKHFEVDPARVRVIHNGIDLDLYRPVDTDATRKAFEIEGRYVLFVGRTSRQKGMGYLIDAMEHIEPDVQLVCCTSAPDTKEVEDEIAAKVAGKLRIKWINSLLREDQYVELYANASVFACPSVYEPFGIINLEAMACETPVVASAVGGILETVVDGQTGLLVEPANPRALAEAINRLLRNPAMALELGRNGRRRVEQHFSWSSIASTTWQLYAELAEERRRRRESKTQATAG